MSYMHALCCPRGRGRGRAVLAGACLGRALLFDAWSTEAGLLGRALLPAPAQVPTHASMQACEERVRQQADHVRALKAQLGSASSKVRPPIFFFSSLLSPSTFLFSWLHAIGVAHLETIHF